MPARRYMEEIGSAAMLAGKKRSAGVAPEVNLQSVNKAAHSAFETQRRCHQKSKTGYQWPHKRTHVLHFVLKRDTTHPRPHGCKTLMNNQVLFRWSVKCFRNNNYPLFISSTHATNSQLDRTNANLKQCWDALLLFRSCTQVISVFSCVQFQTT